MLAFLPEEEVHSIIQTYGLPAFTPNTITSEEALYEELAAIRKRGYAFDHEEETLGVRCIAAPIRNAKGYPTAAISISGAVLSMQEEQVYEYADVLLNTCHALSNNANGQNLLLKQKKELEEGSVCPD